MTVGDADTPFSASCRIGGGRKSDAAPGVLQGAVDHLVAGFNHLFTGATVESPTAAIRLLSAIGF